MAENQEVPPFYEQEGHELFRPLKTIKGSDQMRLLGRLKKMGLISDDSKRKSKQAAVKEAEKNLDLEDLADLVDYVGEKFTFDAAKFDEFTSGENGYERAINLVIGFAQLVGEGKNSGN